MFSQKPQAGAAVQGTGLGMAIVKQLLDIMGGKISLKSAPERGSFIRVLPFQCGETRKNKSSEEIGLSDCAC
ncbi:MAG: ATP-binding protein [Candidatus Borkfalkia sp.]